MPLLYPLLLLAATALNGLLAGASLDQSIKQLPARHRIGMVAYSAYSRAADLGPGIVWYATLGIGAALLTVAAAALAYIQAILFTQALPLYLAAGTSLAHSLATAQAAPTNFRQRQVSDDATQLAMILGQFERWQIVRVVFQVTSFGLLLWALVAICSA